MDQRMKSFTQNYVRKFPEEIKLLAYINQLSTLEKKAMLIAYEHLETSFDLLKSNGYVEWVKTNI